MYVKKGDLVTAIFPNATENASNTCYVIHITPEVAFLGHPLQPDVIIQRYIRDLNTMLATGKCSSERALDFAKSKSEQFELQTKNDLDALCVAFIVRRSLTFRQKNLLANILGRIAENTYQNDIKSAMQFITNNVGALDEFNKLWYNNFKRLFDGTQAITSKKQRSAIFNMAGFIMSELNNPKYEITNKDVT